MTHTLLVGSRFRGKGRYGLAIHFETKEEATRAMQWEKMKDFNKDLQFTVVPKENYKTVKSLKGREM